MSVYMNRRGEGTKKKKILCVLLCGKKGSIINDWRSSAGLWTWGGGGAVK